MSVRSKAASFSRTDINGFESAHWADVYGIKILLLIVSCIASWFLPKGFSEGFAAFGSSVFAIFVGLFVTSLIFSLDKFYSKKLTKNLNSTQKLHDDQENNQTKIFAYVTGWTIVLSLVVILLLSLSALFPKVTQLDVFELTFVSPIESYADGKLRESIWLFVTVIFLVFQRLAVVYFSLRVMWNTAMIVVTMVDFMTAKMDRQ